MIVLLVLSSLTAFAQGQAKDHTKNPTNTVPAPAANKAQYTGVWEPVNYPEDWNINEPSSGSDSPLVPGDGAKFLVKAACKIFHTLLIVEPLWLIGMRPNQGFGIINTFNPTPMKP